jgi:hypothetical protein
MEAGATLAEARNAGSNCSFRRSRTPSSMGEIPLTTVTGTLTRVEKSPTSLTPGSDWLRRQLHRQPRRRGGPRAREAHPHHDERAAPPPLSLLRLCSRAPGLERLVTNDVTFLPGRPVNNSSRASIAASSSAAPRAIARSRPPPASTSRASRSCAATRTSAWRITSSWSSSRARVQPEPPGACHAGPRAATGYAISLAWPLVQRLLLH